MTIKYKISKETLNEVVEVLRDYQFWTDEDGEGYNNDEVIEVLYKLEEEIKQNDTK